MPSNFEVSYIAIWILVILQGALFLVVIQQLWRLQRLIEEGGLPGEHRLPLGSVGPECTGLDVVSGRGVDSTLEFGGTGGVIVFISPDCEICKNLLDSLRDSQHALPSIIVVCWGSERPCAGIAMRIHRHFPLILDVAGQTSISYGISTTPSAVVLDRVHKLRGYGYPKNAEEIMNLYSNSLSKIVSDGQTVLVSSSG